MGLLDKYITERDFTQTVIDLAQRCGWLVYHQFEQKVYARRVGAGFPDLVLLKAHRIIFAELKSQKGVFTAAQQEWITQLRAARSSPYIQVYVWRPRDWEIIEKMLSWRPSRLGIIQEEVEALARTIERSWWKRLYLGLKYSRWLF